MKSLLLLTLSIFAAACGVALAQSSASYDDVMLIVNDRSWNSAEIGRFFAERRKIPQGNILHIDADTAETMDSATFVGLRWKIQGAMKERGLVDRINYIVTTKGCPLRVATAVWDRTDTAGRLVHLGGQASFEDCLMLINGADSTLILSIKTGFPTSRYYGSNRHFRRDPQKLPMYLVTRLDAYTVDQVKSYITKAENPVMITDGLWVLDVDPTRGGGYKMGNDWMFGADSILRSRDLNVLLNTDTVYLHGSKGVVGYSSWGSNDNHSGGGEAAKPGNTWLNGSIAETYVSTGGRSFTTGAGYGQSLVADWIAEGVSAVKGYTDEPYLVVMARPNILFDRYTSGYNMAESYWSASPLIAWRQVVIGDPKMRPGLPLEAKSDWLDFGSRERYDIGRDTIWFRNAYGEPLQIAGVDVTGTGARDYTTGVIGGSVLPLTLAAGDSMGIDVSFGATDFGNRDAQVSVRYIRPGKTNVARIGADLNGTGLRVRFTYPDTLRYTTPAKSKVTVDTVTFRNLSATDTLVIRRTLMSPSDASSRFAVIPLATTKDTIPPGGEWLAAVEYTPTVSEIDSSTLTVYTTGEPTTFRIKFYGMGGVSAAPENETRSAGAGISSVSPNPFSGSTVLRYTVPTAGVVRLEVLDPLGNHIATLVDEIREAGSHTALFDADGLPSGMYLCRLVVEGFDGAAVIRPVLHTR